MRWTLRSLLALALLLPAGSRAATQTCDFTSDATVNAAEGLISGTVDCTTSGASLDADPEDDNYTCSGGHTITIAGATTWKDVDFEDCELNLSSANRRVGAASDPGPFTFTLNASLASDDLYVDHVDGRFKIRGDILKWGRGVTHPTFIEDPQRESGAYAMIGDVIPCGGDPTCAGDADETRISYPESKFDTSTAAGMDVDWAGFIGAIEAGYSICAMTAHDREVFPPEWVNHCLPVVAKDDTCTGETDCWIDVDTNQMYGGAEPDYPAARRNWRHGTLQADVGPDPDRCYPALEATELSADAEVTQHVIYLEKGGAIQPVAYTISVSRNNVGGGGEDEFCVPQRGGVITSHDASNADEDEYWIGPHGIMPGDPYWAEATVRVDGPGLDKIASVAVAGVFDVKGAAFTNLSTVQSRATATVDPVVEACQRIKLALMANEDAGNGLVIADNDASDWVCRWINTTSGGALANASGYHILNTTDGVDADSDGVDHPKFWDIAAAYMSDDVLYAENPVTCAFQRWNVGPWGDPGFDTSGNTVDFAPDNVQTSCQMDDFAVGMGESREGLQVIPSGGAMGTTQGSIKARRWAIVGSSAEGQALGGGLSRGNVNGVRAPQFYDLVMVDVGMPIQGSNGDLASLLPMWIERMSAWGLGLQNANVLARKPFHGKEVLILDSDVGPNNTDTRHFELAESPDGFPRAIMQDWLIWNTTATGKTTPRPFFFGAANSGAGVLFQRVVYGNDPGFAPEGINRVLGDFGSEQHTLDGFGVVNFDDSDASVALRTQGAGFDQEGNVCLFEVADLIDNGTLDADKTIVDTPPQLPRAGFSPPLSARKGQWREHGCWPRRAGVYKQTWAQGVYKLTPLYEGEAPDENAANRWPGGDW